MKEYCVEYNYNCCLHIVVDAMSEEDAYEKADDIYSNMTHEEWLNEVQIDLVEEQIFEN